MPKPAETCQSCHLPLQAGDDVVVCPDCGAPYHRACYQKEGHCAFEGQHAEGFVYAPEPKPEAPPPTGGPEGAAPAGGQPGAQAGSGVICPHCRTVNDRMNVFCEGCGRPLHGEAQQPRFGAPPPFEQAFAGGAGAVTGEIDGIPAADWAAFIGPAAPQYLPRLAIQAKQKRKWSFMFSPFVLGAFYFAYRKMWAWAAIALASFALLNAADMLWILGEAGVPLFPALSQELLRNIADICWPLSFLRQVVFGVFALYLYRRDAGVKIRRVKESAPGADAPGALQRAGGVSVVGPVVLVALYFVFSFLLYAWGGESLLSFLLAQYAL